MAKNTTKESSSDGVADFRPATGLSYRHFLMHLHKARLFDWYFEIGTHNGGSLALCRSKSVSVDPYFRVSEKDVIGSKPALHLFQSASDAFFESGFLTRNKIKPSFSFLDGMHLFEYLLRDFINTEAASDPRGVIAMHDCCPSNSDMEQRDLSLVKGGAWTGDVWKLIPILRKYRPDLTLTVLNCKPTGLVLVSNLNPKSKVLQKQYDAILAEFMEVTLLDYGLSQFNSQFEYADAWRMTREGFKLFDDITLDPSLALTLKKVST